jgi:hypothetical protein
VAENVGPVDAKVIQQAHGIEGESSVVIGPALRADV